MATINYDLFWSRYLGHCELQRLEGILRQLDLSDTVDAIKAQRNFSGRLDWPIKAMLRSVFAMSVLQHRSTESFRRELMRNPTLMMALVRILLNWDGDSTNWDDRAFSASAVILFSVSSDLI